ncbi:MAG: response regulator transcription factor [Flavobacteriales bacterium]|nr:response regulator transcription factor [Flavobacteriales bacterium]
MFKKVIVAEDQDDINKGVVASLQELEVPEIQHVQYCDDAYLRIKRAAMDNKPFELLITDLSFNADHREQKLSSGEDLSEVLRKEFPDLKIIMYSVEDRLQRVRHMMQKLGINAYVCKGRHGLKDLSNAIELVNNDKTYLSSHVSNALRPSQDLEIDDFDLLLVEKLSHGLSQDEISSEFKTKNISPSSLSSIEKRLNKLKIEFKANNAIHLVSKVKDLGLI